MRQMQREIAETAGRINGAYSDIDWIPIRYLNRTIKHSTLAGLYRMAKVGLVTPLRDGMNLVAKEYVAAQDPEDPGVLVLSRFAGAARELGSARPGQSLRCRRHRVLRSRRAWRCRATSASPAGGRCTSASSTTTSITGAGDFLRALDAQQSPPCRT